MIASVICDSSGSVYLVNPSSVGIIVNPAGATMAPSSDLAMDLGYTGSGRFRVAYLRNGIASGTRFVSTADKTVANTTTETSLIGTGVGTKAIAANELAAGRTVHVRVKGYLSSTGVPTVTFKVKMGSTAVATSSAIVASAFSNAAFEGDFEITCRTTGGSGTVVCTGFVMVNGTVTPVVTTGTTTISTTVSEDPDFTVTWSAADAANTITGQTAVIDQKS